MKKYLLKRILFSIFSLFVVVMVVMVLVYSLISRTVIFQSDDLWNKKNNNDRIIYEYTQFNKYDYVNYVSFSSFLNKAYAEDFGEDYMDNAEAVKQQKDDTKAIQDANNIKKLGLTYDEDGWIDMKAFTKSEAECESYIEKFVARYKGMGYQVRYLEPLTSKKGRNKPGGNAYLFATQDEPVYIRLWHYVQNFFSIETTNMVEDPELTDRYVRFESDPYSGMFAIVGSGTQHKYLLYFDERFPFIHQQWLHMNLGTSFTTYRDQEITDVINNPTGDLKNMKQQFPNMLGTDEYVDTAIDFHSLSYNKGDLSDADKANFPDKYTVYSFKRSGLSMIENSFVMGIIATILAYAIGLPLGILMARRKDKLADKIGNIYIIFIMAVPSLAYIFMFAALGTSLFNLPYKFANASPKILGYILPIISLSLPSIGSLMKWMRRYMIDQMNSDYVKFARAEGLSEREIYSTHISKNAMIYLVHGLPASILGCLTGAIITERVYAVPGVGNLLTTAINSHDNGIIVACTVFYTSLSILALILGDLLLASYDPRISLSSDKGGGR